MLGRYPDKRPKDLKVTCDGHMYLDNLVSSWGKHQRIQEDDILTALRKHAIRGEEASRFTITCTIGGRTLIKVSPKLQPGSRPPVVERYRTPRTRPSAPNHSPKPARDSKAKLDMSLDELIRSNDGESRFSGSSSSSTKWKNGLGTSHIFNGTAKLPESSAGNVDSSSNQDDRSVLRRSLVEMSLDEAAKLLDRDGNDQAAAAAETERSARVRRSMEQMGLTPGTSHIRLSPGSKKALNNAAQTIDSSPSPPPDRGAPRTAGGDDEDDVALAACAARCFNVSGDVEAPEATGKAETKNEAPPRPPGGNWQQFLDTDDNSMWYYWPGPGGEWWCGPNEGDSPHPYKESGSQ